jgi:hypothetical protein
MLLELQRLVDRFFWNADAGVESDHGPNGLLAETYGADN